MCHHILCDRELEDLGRVSPRIGLYKYHTAFDLGTFVAPFSPQTADMKEFDTILDAWYNVVPRNLGKAAGSPNPGRVVTGGAP